MFPKCVPHFESPQTGIVLDIYTNEPGLQFYAGNFLDGTVKGKKGIVYNRRASVCLEHRNIPILLTSRNGPPHC